MWSRAHTQKKQALVCPLTSIFGHKLSLTCFQDSFMEKSFSAFSNVAAEARSVPCAPAAFLQVTVKGAKGSSRKPSGAAPDRVPWSMGPSTSGSCFLRPDSCRPPWEAHTYRRVDLQGALDLHWRASVSPRIPHHRLRSHRPPTRRSTKSYFGPASLLPPHSGNEKMQTILFPEEGSAF